MDCFWICCDDADNVLSVNNIHLGTHKTGAKVTWHTNRRTSGTWWCGTGEAAGTTYLFVEFAAGRGEYKRHVLQEVGPKLFKLLDRNHQLYENGLWSRQSEGHYNKTKVYLQQFEAPPLPLPPSAATTAAEAAEATGQPNYRCSCCPYEMYDPSRKTEREEVICERCGGSMCEIREMHEVH